MKLPGVSGSSNDVERAEISALAVPAMSRCSGNAQLILSTGPEPMERMMGPESPSVS